MIHYAGRLPALCIQYRIILPLCCLLVESSPLPAGDASLEVYRLPKDAWMKELEPVQQMLEQAVTLSDEDQSSSMNVRVFL